MDNLSDLFDIAHVDALQLVKILEDREFLNFWLIGPKTTIQTIFLEQCNLFDHVKVGLH